MYPPMFWLALVGLAIPNLYGLVNWYSRLRTIETTVAQHAEKFKVVDANAERLVRIETKLDLLMEGKVH